MDTSVQIYMYVHIFRLILCIHTPLSHMCYPDPQSNIKGQTSAEEGWHAHPEDTLTSSRPSAPREDHESESSLVELTGHSLSVPRLSLPGMIQQSLVCRCDCGIGGAKGWSQYSSEPRESKA